MARFEVPSASPTTTNGSGTPPARNRSSVSRSPSVTESASPTGPGTYREPSPSASPESRLRSGRSLRVPSASPEARSSTSSSTTSPTPGRRMPGAYQRSPTPPYVLRAPPPTPGARPVFRPRPPHVTDVRGYDFRPATLGRKPFGTARVAASLSSGSSTTASPSISEVENWMPPLDDPAYYPQAPPSSATLSNISNWSPPLDDPNYYPLPPSSGSTLSDTSNWSPPLDDPDYYPPPSSSHDSFYTARGSPTSGLGLGGLDATRASSSHISISSDSSSSDDSSDVQDNLAPDAALQAGTPPYYPSDPSDSSYSPDASDSSVSSDSSSQHTALQAGTPPYYPSDSSDSSDSSSQHTALQAGTPPYYPSDSSSSSSDSSSEHTASRRPSSEHSRSQHSSPSQDSFTTARQSPIRDTDDPAATYLAQNLPARRPGRIGRHQPQDNRLVNVLKGRRRSAGDPAAKRPPYRTVIRRGNGRGQQSSLILLKERPGKEPEHTARSPTSPGFEWSDGAAWWVTDPATNGRYQSGTIAREIVSGGIGERTADRVGNLLQHENLVNMRDAAGFEADVGGVRMEASYDFCSHGTLNRLMLSRRLSPGLPTLQHDPGLPEDVVWHVLIALLRAASHLHSQPQPIVHLAIDPANVFFTAPDRANPDPLVQRYGKVKLGNFSKCVVLPNDGDPLPFVEENEELSSDEVVALREYCQLFQHMAQPPYEETGYEAPEVLSGNANPVLPGPCSDLFSIGVVCFAMMTGYTLWNLLLDRRFLVRSCMPEHGGREVLHEKWRSIPLEQRASMLHRVFNQNVISGSIDGRYSEALRQFVEDLLVLHPESPRETGLLCDDAEQTFEERWRTGRRQMEMEWRVVEDRNRRVLGYAR